MLTGTSEMVTECSSYIEDLHLEYSLESERRIFEGESYIAYGVSVKMIDENKEEIYARIMDITSDTQAALNLLQLLKASKVSPMCLKLFVEDFLIN